jgi:hypothetical protein
MAVSPYKFPTPEVVRNELKSTHNHVSPKALSSNQFPIPEIAKNELRNTQNFIF